MALPFQKRIKIRYLASQIPLVFAGQPTALARELDASCSGVQRASLILRNPNLGARSNVHLTDEELLLPEHDRHLQDVYHQLFLRTVAPYAKPIDTAQETLDISVLFETEASAAATALKRESERA